MDVDWKIKTYEKEHRWLQTRNVKACTYKFLAKKIVQQIESNPTVPTRALQEQLQHEYQVDTSKMNVFRAKTDELNQVRGDYAGKYATLRDYVQELLIHEVTLLILPTTVYKHPQSSFLSSHIRSHLSYCNTVNFKKSFHIL
uniref:Uncharacterized protein n=1 Tax=Lactuca sativa TaxID=4236 RepID=A0A9R1VAG7_LACSA|nr:hypothetical protein LSAT_V11C600321700 [Lactuca sativa]